ncbi:predicted protein [Chaetoceros tenuissimus]|uniref:Uncharacterized protein n=1 Tax=Chaetoceros tenuissimus TaxID=426638 RepID=A0AAD3CQR4_9STRA|nr:predicted protein [Chaetoceros tenuissimus]
MNIKSRQSSSIALDKKGIMIMPSKSILDSEENSQSAELRYDASTWRMYYRIVNGRKRRTEIIQKRNAAAGITGQVRKRSEIVGPSSTMLESSSPNDLSLETRTRARSFTRPRSSSALSEATSSSFVDEGIFTLEL